MAAEDPIAAKVLEDLKDGPFSCTSLTRLSGGSANFTYRGTLTSPLPNDETSASTVIIKHAEPYIPANPSWKFDVTRSYYEQAMLTALMSLPVTTFSGTHVKTPNLHSYSPQTNTQILADHRDALELKQYITTHPVPAAQATRLGVALGKWLQSFHLWASAAAQEPLRETMRENRQMAQLKFGVNYGRLVPTIDMFPAILAKSREVFERVAELMRKEMESGKGDLIHGDFWSGNFLLHFAATLPTSRNDDTIIIIDWELSHIGSRAFDLGQCFAELYLLTHFRAIAAGTQLIESLMNGYGPLAEAKVGDDSDSESAELDLAFRVALHFGTHLVVWPCRVPGWGGEGEGNGQEKAMERCVEMGRDYIRHAYERNREFFRGGVLHAVFFPSQ